MIRELAIILGAGVLATLLAELLGPANLGTALTFGQIAVVGAVVAILLFGGGRRGRRRAPPDQDPSGASRRGR